MKADATRIRNALARPVPDIRLYLLFGPDEAGARSLAAILANAMGPEAERIDLEPSLLKTSPGRLADEAAALSLFGGARSIRVAGAGEESLEAVTLLLAAERAGNPVVVVAPTLKTTSRLVKLATDSPHALAFGCYEPTARDAEQLVTQLARDAGLQPALGVARRIAEASGGDRAVMAQEIAKLALFLDADKERPHVLDDEAIDAIGADLGDSEQADLVTALIAGDLPHAGEALSRLAQSTASPVAWLRAIVRRLLTLAEIRADVDAGGETGAVLKRHRVHFREEPQIRAALSRWSPDRLAAALDELRAAERAIMAAANAGDVLAEHAAITVTGRAARR